MTLLPDEQTAVFAELASYTPDSTWRVHTTLHCGTRYHARITDGAVYLRDTCACRWLIDLIVVAQHATEIREQDFQVWRLLRLAGGRAEIWATDGEESDRQTTIYRQVIEMCPFPLEEIAIYATREIPDDEEVLVIQLPNELAWRTPR